MKEMQQGKGKGGRFIERGREGEVNTEGKIGYQ